MMTSADPAQAGISRYLNIDGLRFHYVTWGKEGAPVLLCLHGLRSYGRTFQPLAASLSQDFQVLALDQRGRGETDWDPAGQYYTRRYAEDMEKFVELLELESLHMLGHSMGGINALVYSLANGRRLRSLILEDCGPGASRNSPGATRIDAELRGTPTTFPDWDAARRFWRSIRPDVTEAAIDSRVAHSMRETAAGIGWIHDQAGIAAARLAPAEPMPDLWPCVEQLHCPTLLLRGSKSDYLSQETLVRMRKANHHIEGVEIEGAGHYIHDDQPERFNAAVGGFLHQNAG